MYAFAFYGDRGTACISAIYISFQFLVGLCFYYKSHSSPHHGLNPADTTSPVAGLLIHTRGGYRILMRGRHKAIDRHASPLDLDQWLGSATQRCIVAPEMLCPLNGCWNPCSNWVPRDPHEDFDVQVGGCAPFVALDSVERERKTLVVAECREMIPDAFPDSLRMPVLAWHENSVPVCPFLVRGGVLV